VSDTPIAIRPARAGEALFLSALAVRSKAHWGYDAAFLDRCREELTVTPVNTSDRRTAVAEIVPCLIGFYSIERVAKNQLEIEHFFVEPEMIGGGVGRTLFNDLIRYALAAGVRTIGIDADPNAAQFYRHMGCTDAGVSASASIPGRFLPRLTFTLPDIPPP